MAIEEEPAAGVPEWVVTFGDMMSLLLTFFIMLVSMSELKSEQRVAEAVQALRHRFGKDIVQAPGAVKQRGARIKAPQGDQPRVKGIRPGEQVQIGGSIYFPEGAFELDDERRRQLQEVIEQLKGKPQKIEIRGHTTRRPLPQGSQFADHWHLAYARCHEVLEMMLSDGIDPRRIRLGVAAGNEPARVGRDPLHEHENDRVEVFMLSEVVEDFEKPDGDKSTEVPILSAN